jgi:EAL domain-containing protein (putative c-di-GMP-specific phosphodiesterase class I)
MAGEAEDMAARLRAEFPHALRSLVRPIASRSSFRTIVRTTVDLAHQLGVTVVAEGVESEAVRSELRALGCDIGQGYFLGRPMPPGAFADWMRDRGPSRPAAGPGRSDCGACSTPARCS